MVGVIHVSVAKLKSTLRRASYQRLGWAEQVGGDEVGLAQPAEVDGIGLARLERVELAVGLRHLEAAGVEGELLAADDGVLELLLHLGPADRVDVLLHAAVAGGHVDEHLAARHVHVAGDGHERKDGLARLGPVGALVDGDAPGDGGRLGVGVEPGRAVDLLGRHAADLSCLLGRHLGHAFGQLVEPEAPAIHEVLVVEVLADDDVEHSHGQRRVGAGAAARSRWRASRSR